jgi:dephospho-CoA kinase
MTIIGLVGAAGVGKDTVADYLVKHHGFKRYAFADAVRDFALAIDPIIETGEAVVRLSDLVEHFGWDHSKRAYPEVRRLLQRIGTEGGRQIAGDDVWVNIVDDKWNDDGCPPAVITDCRFPNEVQYVHVYDGWIVEIIRPTNTKGITDAVNAQHASEQLRVTADARINNNDTIDFLYAQVENVLTNFYQ